MRKTTYRMKGKNLQVLPYIDDIPHKDIRAVNDIYRAPIFLTWDVDI